MATLPRRVVGYVRVSTQEQDDSGLGQEVQRQAIGRECRHRRWKLVETCEDVASGSSRERRPGLAHALDLARSGEADTLMVYKLDRLSRTVADFGAILDQARTEGWNIVIMDIGVDLSTPAGEMVASIMAVLAQWERRVISQRTREALAVRRAQGGRLGRPIGVDPDVEAMLMVLRGRGLGLRAIATELNRLAIPTAQGGSEWRASSVRSILGRLDAA